MLSNLTSLNLSPYLALYDQLIPKNHLLRQINDLVDFSFVYETLESQYSLDNGRTAVCPIQMFKYLLLKSMYDLSDNDVVERARYDLSFKYFLGLSPEDEVIHPSLLSKFRRQRLKDTDLLDILIQKTVKIALEEGVIESKELIMDATHTHSIYQSRKPQEVLHERAKQLRKAAYKVNERVKADFPPRNDDDDLAKELEYCQELITIIEQRPELTSFDAVKQKLNNLKEAVEDDLHELRSLGKDDAKLGHKSADSSFFGYKTHIAMNGDRIITAATVSTGERADGKELQALYKKSINQGLEINTVIGDAAYSSKDNIEFALKNEFDLVSKLNPSVSDGCRTEEDQWDFNKDAGLYQCPEGHLAIRKARQGRKNDRKNQRETYFFNVEKCKICPMKDGCYKEGAKSKSYSVTIQNHLHQHQLAFQNTVAFKEKAKSRYKIEAKNSELKNRHGMKKAKSVGLFGVTIQVGATIFITNMKRIIKLKEEKK